jgi:predicted metal-dependent HD superfamily phosphohydrolase
MEPLEKAIDYISKFYNEKVDSKYEYHNLNHSLSVLAAAQNISQKSNLSADDQLIVEMAALFHDTGYSEGPENHEHRSATIAEEYLKNSDFDSSFIEKVKVCILNTKVGTVTSDPLSQILRDADMSGLASKKFFKITNKLRKEINNTHDQKISKKDWDKTNIDFIQKCFYMTQAARDLYKNQKEKNLKSLLKKQEKRNRKEKAEKSKFSISNNKSAQTQFKTALRNHIDLSNIADNKANIMISVNALILTVALPFLIEKSMGNTSFLLPTIILSIVCLVSMIFATLATRPIHMKGNTTPEQIAQNGSNLFFFGNYHKMNYQDYKSGVEHVLSNQKALDDSIIRDLFFLGKSLGAKFEYLRFCYNIFMYGITITVLSILIVFFI